MWFLVSFLVFSIILLTKGELAALFQLCCGCVLSLLLTVPRVDLKAVIAAFPGQNHILFVSQPSFLSYSWYWVMLQPSVN